MAAVAVRALRQSFRALEQSIDPRLAEMPSFRAELKKAAEAGLPQDVRGLTEEQTRIDWAELNSLFPDHSSGLAALEKFYHKRREAVMAAQPSISPKVHAAYFAKVDELDQHAEYARGPIETLTAELEARRTELEEMERFLIDVKINDLMARNPEWKKEIEENLYHLKWENPLKNTPLGDE